MPIDVAGQVWYIPDAQKMPKDWDCFQVAVVSLLS